MTAMMTLGAVMITILAPSVAHTTGSVLPIVTMPLAWLGVAFSVAADRR